MRGAGGMLWLGMLQCCAGGVAGLCSQLSYALPAPLFLPNPCKSKKKKNLNPISGKKKKAKAVQGWFDPGLLSLSSFPIFSHHVVVQL